MAVIYRKQPKKFSFFLKICMVFIIFGIVLHSFDLVFWGELSYFVSCTVVLAGIEYKILHRITYFTGKKIERVASVFFYTGIACLVLKLLLPFVFKEDYYAGISPFMEVYGIIIFCLTVGMILLPLSVGIIFLKFRKLMNFLKIFF